MARRVAIEYRALTREFIDQMDRPSGAGLGPWPKCMTVYRRSKRWATNAQQVGSYIWTHSWKSLHEGFPVRREVIELLIRYLNEERKTHLELEAISVLADVSPEEDPSEDPWRLQWGGVAKYLKTLATIPEEAYCSSEADIEAAARLTAIFVGRNFARANSSPTDEEACAIGLRIMQRDTFPAYVSYLRAIHAKNPRTLLFAVARDDAGVYQRVGMLFTVPLKDRPYCDLREGRMHERQITPDDFQCPSSRIFISHLADGKLSEFRHVRRRSLAQLQCAFFQFASFSPKIIFINPKCPIFLTFAGNKSNAARASNYGFNKTGICMSGTTSEMMELTSSSLLDYTLTWAVLSIFQALIGISVD